VVKSQFDLRPGLTLGRNYFVVEFLGSGWEGEVYKVEERRTGIIRAAKLFYLSHRPNKARLKKYAQKMYRLRNCSVVTQYIHRDIARIGKETTEILVSDFIEGILLSDFIAKQPHKRLSYFEALHLLYSMAAGIEHIHFQGEYHGDIHSDNILVKRKGLSFEVNLIDFFDIGYSTKAKIQNDVYDLISVFYELIGGPKGYTKANGQIRQIVMGRKHNLIRNKFKNAGQLRLALDNLDW
jgi:serine/threonine protein kinase